MERKCTHCGSGRLSPGFLQDLGQGSMGDLRWVAGPLERGILGGAKRMGRNRYEVDAYACEDCSHLELYVGARH